MTEKKRGLLSKILKRICLYERIELSWNFIYIQYKLKQSDYLEYNQKIYHPAPAAER